VPPPHQDIRARRWPAPRLVENTGLRLVASRTVHSRVPARVPAWSPHEPTWGKSVAARLTDAESQTSLTNTTPRDISATALANVCHSTGPQLTSTCSKHLVRTAQATYTSAFFGLVMRIILLLEGRWPGGEEGHGLRSPTRRWSVAAAADSLFPVLP
jgi:hypothetical protein